MGEPLWLLKGAGVTRVGYDDAIYVWELLQKHRCIKQGLD